MTTVLNACTWLGIILSTEALVALPSRPPPIRVASYR
jgi:hypothetical protein